MPLKEPETTGLREFRKNGEQHRNRRQIRQRTASASPLTTGLADVLISDLFLSAEIYFLIDMILLALCQAAGLIYHDPLPPDVNHGFMFCHHILHKITTPYNIKALKT